MKEAQTQEGGSMKKPNGTQRLEAAKKMFETSKEILLLEIFKTLIKPLADRHNWEISWGMGGVAFYNRKGEDVTDTQAVENLTMEVSKFLDNEYQDLWDVLGCFHSEGSFYHKSFGITRYSGMTNTHTKFKHQEAL